MSNQAPLALNYNTNVYVAVSLTSNSQYTNSPIVIPGYPSVTQVGSVGALPDVKLLRVPKNEWQNIGKDVLQWLEKDRTNIKYVDVQVPRQRTKRGGRDEL